MVTEQGRATSCGGSADRDELTTAMLGKKEALGQA
jgi:hypothetical protein